MSEKGRCCELRAKRLEVDEGRSDGRRERALEKAGPLRRYVDPGPKPPHLCLVA